jgi:NADH:ubiquinone oxidoreductase subunit K
MVIRNALRVSISLGWLLNAILLERILTLGAITDISGVGQNPPLFVAIGAALTAVAIAMVLAVIADTRTWPAASLALSVVFLVAGGWLRLESGDDSGAAIALIALAIAVLSWRALVQRRRVPRSVTRPPGD